MKEILVISNNPDHDLNLERQWQLYLKRNGQSEEHMHPEQLRQTRNAFYGGITQLLFIFRDGIGALDRETDALKAMEVMINQVEEYWKPENH